MKASFRDNKNIAKLIRQVLQQNPRLRTRLPVELVTYVCAYPKTNLCIDLNILLNI